MGRRVGDQLLAQQMNFQTLVHAERVVVRRGELEEQAAAAVVLKCHDVEVEVAFLAVARHIALDPYVVGDLACVGVAGHGLGDGQLLAVVGVLRRVELHDRQVGVELLHVGADGLESHDARAFAARVRSDDQLLGGIGRFAEGDPSGGALQRHGFPADVGFQRNGDRAAFRGGHDMVGAHVEGDRRIDARLHDLEGLDDPAADDDVDRAVTCVGSVVGRDGDREAAAVVALVGPDVDPLLVARVGGFDDPRAHVRIHLDGQRTSVDRVGERFDLLAEVEVRGVGVLVRGASRGQQRNGRQKPGETVFRMRYDSFGIHCSVFFGITACVPTRVGSSCCRDPGWQSP